MMGGKIGRGQTKAKAKCSHCGLTASFTPLRLEKGLWPCCKEKLTTKDREDRASDLYSRRAGSALLDPKQEKVGNKRAWRAVLRARLLLRSRTALQMLPKPHQEPDDEWTKCEDSDNYLRPISRLPNKHARCRLFFIKGHRSPSRGRRLRQRR